MREPRGQRWDELYQSWYSRSYSENLKFRFSVYQSDPLSLYELDLFVLFLFLWSLSKYHCYKICLICVTIRIITKSFLWVISESSPSYSELTTTIYYLFDLLHISQTSEHIGVHRTSDLIGHTLEHYDFIMSQVATWHIGGEHSYFIFGFLLFLFASISYVSVMIIAYSSHPPFCYSPD